jgi:hypothetical protein
LLIARDLLLHDPIRILAWRLGHDARLASLPPWLALLSPGGGGDLDRDPIALLLSGLAVGLAVAYLAAALLRADGRLRGALIGIGGLLLVVAPTLALIAMGAATGRPYGQDGGVVQLPLAIDRIVSGHSPYGADYSDSMLGKQSRASEFWAPWGGNPILRHHAYLPGTHLLTLPVQLACRRIAGGFDPRVVTLLFLAIAVAAAVRIVRRTPQRLCAAALVALNPLVYWYQIFGANDVVFAAFLLLAVALAQRGRPLLAGALLGLACATKQLAWPFAPFLLAQLSGATGLALLWRPEALRRMAAPALAAALVFAAVVLPVAALDFRAFYADIVAYNVGLPGADNYPLGGTPGFGFANFLLYFGKVDSLRDYFPFGGFYLVLAPLGLLLLRAQLRTRAASAVLVSGSVLLLLVLYFSRVVHPNYLIGAALLLPIGVLARGSPADLAVAPLLLLGLGSQVTENQLFRATWDEAVSLRLPAHVSGLSAALLPRGGPGLSLDPIGALVGALAAGLGVAYATAAALGASARWRCGLGALSAALVVGVPAAALVAIGHRTGAVRSQDRWAIQVPADAGRLERGESPYQPPFERRPAAREAWTTSFRLDPPRRLEPDSPLMPPAASVLGILTRAVGILDGRLLSLAAYALLVALATARAPAPARPLALAAAALSPFIGLGTTFGAGTALPLLVLLACAHAAASGRPALAGMLGGVAGALDHRALLAAPLLVWGTPPLRGGRRLAGLLGGYAAFVLPVTALGPGAWARLLATPPAAEPGVGLVNLLAFRGWQDSAGAHAVLALSPLLLLAIALRILRVAATRPVEPLPAAALVVLVALFLAPSASAEALGIPLLLLVLARTGFAGVRSG